MLTATRTTPHDCHPEYLSIQFFAVDMVETVEPWERVHVAIDSKGEPVGFEILDAETSLVGRIPVLPDSTALRDLVNHHVAECEPAATSSRQ